MTRTPAIVRCTAAGVPFSVHEYRHEPGAASYGLEAAAALGIDPNCVYKTLVTSVDGSLAVAVVPVSGSLDLKALAHALAGKKAELADPDVAQRKTGYVVGGISPIGQKSALPTVIDASAEALTTMYVSAGARGMELGISPIDLAQLTSARFAAIARA